MTRWHPWRLLRRLSYLEIVYRTDMPPGLLGYTVGHTIVLASDLRQDERRCTLTHELCHIARGDTEGCTGPAEETIKRQAARLLIPTTELAEALRWSTDLSEVAEALWVDADTLLTRMSNLHPAESALIRRATEHHREAH